MRHVSAKLLRVIADRAKTHPQVQSSKFIPESVSHIYDICDITLSKQLIKAWLDMVEDNEGSQEVLSLLKGFLSILIPESIQIENTRDEYGSLEGYIDIGENKDIYLSYILDLAEGKLALTNEGEDEDEEGDDKSMIVSSHG